MASLNRTIGGTHENQRQMLLAAGIGEYNAILSLPYMMMMPRTCDPYTQGVMQLVEGLQNLLNARGQAVPVDGHLGPESIRALRVFSGAGWGDKTWLQLYGDVLRGRHAPIVPVDQLQVLDQIPTGGLTDVIGGVAANPLAWIAGGAALFYFFGIKHPTYRSRR